MTIAARLRAGMNASGGWGYYAGHASRVEPTAWALLALGADVDLAPHRVFFARCRVSPGWLAEDPALPINIGFNALAAFACHVLPGLATGSEQHHLLTALAASSGTTAPQTPETPQNNSLRGWAWIDGTFSWVEPTALAVIALKRALHDGWDVPGAPARVEEAERLLLDRVCDGGGWNFGNATMMGQDLRPYVPTTALGLIAMQDRRDHPAVSQSLRYLEAHWQDEPSVTAAALSLISLATLGRPVAALRVDLERRAADAVAAGHLHALALASLALDDPARTFRI
ncbi:MAG: hypothetical protein IT184_04270 [Acidobacteria bacterium]|nr:hypothetical protein [Acidobacteriota bacterium]